MIKAENGLTSPFRFITPVTHEGGVSEPVENSMIMWHVSVFPLFIDKLLYSLLPSVGQSAAELMQVTSTKRPVCTHGCCLGHFLSLLDAKAFIATGSH